MTDNSQVIMTSSSIRNCHSTNGAIDIELNTQLTIDDLTVDSLYGSGTCSFLYSDKSKIVISNS